MNDLELAMRIHTDNKTARAFRASIDGKEYEHDENYWVDMDRNKAVNRLLLLVQNANEMKRGRK